MKRKRIEEEGEDCEEHELSPSKKSKYLPKKKKHHSQDLADDDDLILTQCTEVDEENEDLDHINEEL